MVISWNYINPCRNFDSRQIFDMGFLITIHIRIASTLFGNYADINIVKVISV